MKETPMSDPAPVTKPSTDEIPREILDLAEAINFLPDDCRQKVDPFLNRVIDSTRRRRKILSLVQDALSQLRLDMKYLAFDLEATRRERDEYRRKIEET
jgi:phosphate starvation-inducible protein PhoH